MICALFEAKLFNKGGEMKKNRSNMNCFIRTCLCFLIFTLFLSPLTQAKDKKAADSKTSDYIYQTIPIAIQMEAGNTHWDAWSSGKTIIAGTGWIMPFGRGSYHYGMGYAEATDELRPDFMDSPSWTTPYPTKNLCIYHLQDGDLYAYDGIVANLEQPTEDGKTDYLLEVVVGGTGKFKGANGIILGRAVGRGKAVKVGGPFPLPDVIVKTMEGYVNVKVKKTDFNTSMPVVGIMNPQKRPDVFKALASGELIPVNVVMEAGRGQWDPWSSGTTIIAGKGWIEPFGRSNYHYGFGFAEATAELQPDFMEDASWITPYPTKNLCIYHFAQGDLYTYDGIVGNLSPMTKDGKSDYILEVVAGGTGKFDGASGIILGYTFGRGTAGIAEVKGKKAPFPLPDSILKIMEGYVYIKK
jgi:hypothetical protein